MVKKLKAFSLSGLYSRKSEATYHAKILRNHGLKAKTAKGKKNPIGSGHLWKVLYKNDNPKVKSKRR